MASIDLARLRAWTAVPAPRFVGGNRVQLLEGGSELFPRMRAAIAEARREIWLATYIFHDDATATTLLEDLCAAAARGVAVHIVLDGFGSNGTLPAIRRRLAGTEVRLEVFRPLERWWAWLQPGQLRRLHQKLCVCDAPDGEGEGSGEVAFVGGINVIDDRLDLRHGWCDQPRLDFAVELRGPLATAVHATARAMWARAHLARGWREEMRTLARSATRMDQARTLVRQLRGAAVLAATSDLSPMRAAFLVRDNLRQRRAIERSYVEAIRGARVCVDIAVPYFYPGRAFRRALRRAARRGVRVRLLLQGKVDYRIAAIAARALYDELCANGVRIYEYTPAFLHAKVAMVDNEWATVGSSNIDPLSLLLNLEANVVVRDAGFARALGARFEAAFALSSEVSSRPASAGWRGWLRRAGVAWAANLYLRVAGITGRY
ncbi:MAG: cardiolipin synthase ClsB [Burkholderiales bacterium]|nr:cardiolipin synthase ClsB [Burkholderiales bacterium]